MHQRGRASSSVPVINASAPPEANGVRFTLPPARGRRDVAKGARAKSGAPRKDEADCIVTAITVQIPYEMVVPNPLLLIPIAQGFTTVTTSENGIASTSFLVQPVYDHVHILRTGDIGSQAEGDGYWALVTHADGTLVLQDIRSANGQPQNQTEAKPGEEVVMYAYGLGAVSPPVTGGPLSPMPAAVAAALYLRFDYSPDAGAAMPEVGGPPIMNTK